MGASGEDKDFKKEFDRQMKYMKNNEKKNKTKNPEVSRAYAEAADELKQRYGARSPKLMDELQQWHAISKLQEAVYNKFPYGPKPK